MRAAVVTAFVVRCRSRSDPSLPGPGQVLVRLETCGSATPTSTPCAAIGR